MTQSATYFTTNASGDAGTVTVQAFQDEFADAIVACVVSGTSTTQAACGLAQDPDLTGVFDYNGSTTLDADPADPSTVERFDIYWCC